MNVEKQIERLRHVILALPPPLLRKWLVDYVENECDEKEVHALFIALSAEDAL